jgi:hypothetical protein
MIIQRDKISDNEITDFNLTANLWNYSNKKDIFFIPLIKREIRQQI